jgi:hypothetical protein
MNGAALIILFAVAVILTREHPDRPVLLYLFGFSMLMAILATIVGFVEDHRARKKRESGK